VRVSPLPRGAFLHTIIIPTLKLLFFHHRIPIFVNPINNGLEAFDHLVVVPGLARLCQYIGIIPRLSTVGVPQENAENANMELNFWPSVPSNYLLNGPPTYSTYLIACAFIFTILFLPLHYRRASDQRS
jgi:hypothetical protein